ncbi:TAXI family TRAP transporter solute-binding subunit [Algirhabdus cladophorae]|uniref:TAXI family TRAP transporter solute-binding subunit n=1 Tax=Algirhabdus cladophorae TaxID=3377108 RepID=UPI003B8479BE
MVRRLGINLWWNKLATATAMLIALSGVPNTASAQSDELTLTITAGSSTGTYFRFAEEIAAMLPGASFEIVESAGSVQNLRRLIGYEGQSEQKFYQLALVQADVLEQLRDRAKGNGVLESIVDRIKVVMPLYGEEIHIYADVERDVRTLEEMRAEGLLVNAGSETSGTNLTARWLFEQIGYGDDLDNWQNVAAKLELPNMGPGYDVLFDVSGAPSKLGLSLENPAPVTLVPITNQDDLLAIPNSPYRKAFLTPEQYPWLNRPVETLAVTALLVTFDYDERNPYCDLIEDLTRGIVNGLESRQSPASGSHPKWREVDILNASNRSDIYACSARVLNRL